MALQRVAELVADRVADWCAIDLPDGRATRRVGLAPAGAPRPDPPGGELIVPLMAGGEPLGTLSLVRTDAVRRFTGADRQVAEQLGHRAGAAVLSGRLSLERAEIARELQHGLLPPRLPDIPGLDVAALYRPAGELNEVGGDFYDAFPTPAGWMVVIGDVAGQGARAAGLTGLARFTLRSVGQLTGDPVRAAEQLNRTLRDQPELSLCTAVCLLLSPGPGGLEAVSVSMGHPLPALLRDGAATGLGRPGTLAGAFDDAGWTASRTALVPGDARRPVHRRRVRHRRARRAAGGGAAARAARREPAGRRRGRRARRRGPARLPGRAAGGRHGARGARRPRRLGPEPGDDRQPRLHAGGVEELAHLLRAGGERERPRVLAARPRRPAG